MNEQRERSVDHNRYGYFWANHWSIAGLVGLSLFLGGVPAAKAVDPWMDSEHIETLNNRAAASIESINKITKQQANLGLENAEFYTSEAYKHLLIIQEEQLFYPTPDGQVHAEELFSSIGAAIIRLEQAMYAMGSSADAAKVVGYQEVRVPVRLISEEEYEERLNAK